MKASKYQKLSKRTVPENSTDVLVDFALDKTVQPEMILGIRPIDTGAMLNACLGLTGESGEFVDIVKKWVFHGSSFDEDHAKKELGDVMFYVAMMCTAFGWDLDEILKMNVAKIKARYPKGFDMYRANHREEGDV